LEEAFKLTGIKRITEKKTSLEMFYFQLFDVIFKYMNQFLWKKNPTVNYKIVDDIGEDSTKQTQEAYDACVIPIANTMLPIIRSCIEDVYPKAIANLEANHGVQDLKKGVNQIQEGVEIMTKGGRKK
jgi:hypothetical protein